jgi:hypothetical protein
MVKKLRFLLLLCFLVNSFLSFSQHYVIGIDVPSVFLNQFNPSIERSFGKHFSAGLSFETGTYSYGTSGSINQQKLIYELKGNALMPSIRYYPFTKRRIAPKGLSFELYYRHFWLTEKYNGDDYSVVNTPFNFIDPVPANVNTKGNVTNVGLAIAYKFTMGPVIVEPLVGYGTINGGWDSPNERNKIDPFFKTDYNDFLFASRFEIKLGFYFPLINRPVQQLDEIPYVRNNRETIHEPSDSNATRSNKIKLYIYRPDNLYEEEYNYDVKINDSLTVSIKNGSFQLVTLYRSGEYLISAKLQDEKSISVHLETGKTYYLRCGVQVGQFLERPKFKFVKPAVGKTDIGYLKNQ